MNINTSTVNNYIPEQFLSKTAIYANDQSYRMCQ